MFAQRARHRLCDWVLLEPDGIKLTFGLNSSSPPSLGVRNVHVLCVWPLTSRVALCTVCSFLQYAIANCAQPPICRLICSHIWGGFVHLLIHFMMLRATFLRTTCTNCVQPPICRLSDSQGGPRMAPGSQKMHYLCKARP